VTHFYLYNHTTAQNTTCVLDYYKSRGLVTILDWNGVDIESQKEIRTENMFAALNDCLYRGMHKHKYLAFLDFDEFLVPGKHRDLLGLLARLDSKNSEAAGWLFKNAFFYLEWSDDPDMAHTELITLRKTKRRKELQVPKTRSKFICKPEMVVEVGNHMLWETRFKNYKQPAVETELGFMHHYRICETGGKECLRKESEVDRTTWKWKHSIIKRVQRIQKKVDIKCKLRHLKLGY
jgi:hypothetical protein